MSIEEILKQTRFLEDDNIRVDLQVKFKKLEHGAVTPSYSKEGDAGLDLTAIRRYYVKDGEVSYWEYTFGLAFEIPKGYVGLIFPRSSISRVDLQLSNAVGVVDSNYRGEVKARFKITDHNKIGPELYTVGERIAQLIILPYPTIQLEEVEELSNTNRNNGGFGSTGV